MKFSAFYFLRWLTIFVVELFLVFVRIAYGFFGHRSSFYRILSCHFAFCAILSRTEKET